MEYFIDSNVFLRILVKEDERTFRECYQFLKLVDNRRLKAITSSLVLSEIDWVLEGFYKFKKSEVIKCLESILKLKGLKIIDKIEAILAVELYKKYNIKFIDALISSNPQIYQKKVIVVSYDKDFDKIGVKRKEPKEIIKERK